MFRIFNTHPSKRQAQRPSSVKCSKAKRPSSEAYVKNTNQFHTFDL